MRMRCKLVTSDLSAELHVMEVTRRDKWQRLKSWNRHVPSALTWCVGISAMHCSSHMTSGPLTQPSMDAPHGHRYWRLDPTVLPISSQHPGAQLVLTTGADGELLHHLRPHSNFSISFRVVCVSKPGARPHSGPQASSQPDACMWQVVGISCLLGAYVEKAEPAGAPNLSKRDYTVRFFPL